MEELSAHYTADDRPRPERKADPMDRQERTRNRSGRGPKSV